MENSKQISFLKHEADINNDMNDYLINNNIPSDLSISLREKIDFEKYKYKSSSPDDKKTYLETIKLIGMNQIIKSINI